MIYELQSRIDSSHRRYGHIASTHEALGVACEEWDELREAVRSNKLGAIEMEALDLAAVCLRLAMACRERSKSFVERSTK